ncbi:AhpC/TSA family protein [Rhodobacteraceae bacterium RKSG542]|uniref:peroxiredoxin-like family protein n=1 Tax=Pseudovibrio flavus TaxID=2529854 RepID=UPI0012BC799C|nr:peroxiredoxin-like family protein [Pseudovibrio flavus]MTI19311.1 AhpC/TSA family protein [Pseudovibrio flavus]
MLIPRQTVPSLKVDLVGGGTFDLSQEKPGFATVISFYRGLHCPICATYMREMEQMADEYAQRGVNLVSISSDNEERATKMAEKTHASKIRVGYGLSLEKAKEWGLYISAGRGKTSIGIEEPELFSEPGLFFVRPDGTLYFGSVQTMPFARPDFKTLLGALDFCIKNDYPARGEYTGPVA